MTLLTGQYLQARYRILGQLGQGGMGTVYLAEDIRLGCRCAIKESMPDPAAGYQAVHQLRAQFELEARTLASLSHPNLPKVTDYFTEGNSGYLVMEYVEGEDLASILARRQGPLPESSVLIWADQVLAALDYLHGQPNPIVHRDIKPANIILTGLGAVMLVDFGLVKHIDPTNPRTATAMRGMGTPQYTPLEQYAGNVGHTDGRSDIYALGATLYHLLTGVSPANAPQRSLDPSCLVPPRHLAPAISPGTEALLVRSMAVHPDQRIQTAREMRMFLQGVYSAAGPTLALAAPARKLPAWRWAAVGAALLLLAVVGWQLADALGRSAGPPAPTIAATMPLSPAVVAIAPSATPTASPTPTMTATPSPTATAMPQLADLKVTGAGLSMRGIGNGCLVEYPPLILGVCILNAGSAPASTFSLTANSAGDVRVPGLKAGEKQCFDVGPGDSSNRLVNVTLDAENEVAESDEANNLWKEIIAIPTPPARCTATVTVAPVDIVATPTTTSTLTASAKLRVSGASEVNVRAGPGTEYKMLGRLAAGAERDITGRSVSGTWWQFDYGGTGGWVSGRLVALIGPIDQVPVAAAPPRPPTATPRQASGQASDSRIAVPEALGKNPAVSPSGSRVAVHWRSEDASIGWEHKGPEVRIYAVGDWSHPLTVCKPYTLGGGFPGEYMTFTTSWAPDESMIAVYGKAPGNGSGAVWICRLPDGAVSPFGIEAGVRDSTNMLLEWSKSDGYIYFWSASGPAQGRYFTLYKGLPDGSAPAIIRSCPVAPPNQIAKVC